MTRARPYDRDIALDAAQNLFWKKGYHATSLKDLEFALKMKPGSIYAAFTSKENLYLATLDRYFTKNRNALRTLLTEAPSPLMALADHLRSFSKQRTEDAPCATCMLVKTLLDVTEEPHAIATRARSYLDEMTSEIEAGFVSAQQQGELPQHLDTGRIALRYQADMTALRIEAHRGTNPRALIELAEDKALEIESLRYRKA